MNCKQSNGETTASSYEIVISSILQLKQSSQTPKNPIFLVNSCGSDRFLITPEIRYPRHVLELKLKLLECYFSEFTTETPPTPPSETTSISNSSAADGVSIQSPIRNPTKGGKKKAVRAAEMPFR